MRWFDDLAVVVTFRQMDPLYTIDLSDPAQPRRLGELKIPGFSSYLHPIGEDRLLGIGTAATMQGENLGAQAAVFDIGDTDDTRQLEQLTFGRGQLVRGGRGPARVHLAPRRGRPRSPTCGTDDRHHARAAARRRRRLPDPRDLPRSASGAPGAAVAGRSVALVGETVRIIDVG